MKTNRIKRQPKTYFEVIPVEVVRKIAGGDISKTENTWPDNVTVEPVSRKTEPCSAAARSLRKAGR